LGFVFMKATTSDIASAFKVFEMDESE